MTKCTAVASSEAEPVVFLAFLTRVTGGDEELQQFLQRLFGYALTGITREHALAFFHGTGGNGKSVLLNTIAGIFGDYATTAPIDLFLASRGEQHPTGLAGLRGARLVTAIETEEGRPWAESKIKTLTGGDKLSARFMHQTLRVQAVFKSDCRQPQARTMSVDGDPAAHAPRSLQCYYPGRRATSSS